MMQNEIVVIETGSYDVKEPNFVKCGELTIIIDK